MLNIFSPENMKSGRQPTRTTKTNSEAGEAFQNLLGTFKPEPDIYLIMFAREVEQGTEVIFFTSGEQDPLRRSYFISNEEDVNAEAICVLGDIPGDTLVPLTQYLELEPSKLNNLRYLLNRFPLTVLDDNTVDVVHRNPKLAKFITDNCTKEYNLLGLEVSNEIKKLSGSEDGYTVKDDMPISMIFLKYYELRKLQSLNPEHRKF